MARGHLIVGDGHYCGADGEAQRWLGLVAAALAKGLKELSILGDFFELWVGLEGLEQDWHEELFEPLRDLRRRGVRLRYVVGNKDYFVDEWNVRHQLFHEVVDGTVELATPRGRLVLAHGDTMNRRDRQYRLWRAVSRSRPMLGLARALPRPRLARFTERLSQRMRDTNQRHKSYFPETELLARAAELGPGPATLVCGHFHVFRELQEGDKRVVTLPFLGAENAGVWVEDGRVSRFP